MACNSCAKSFSFIRKEKGCPGCGFSYCSKCLNYKTFVPKINTEAMVCKKCELKKSSSIVTVEPPDAYFKRTNIPGTSQDGSTNKMSLDNLESKDKEILERLNKLKEDKQPKISSDQEIAERLKKIKDVKTATDKELSCRLAKLKGVEMTEPQKVPLVQTDKNKTEQEQADELMKQYMAQVRVDENYKNGFDEQIDSIQTRLHKLKGVSNEKVPSPNGKDSESEDEEESVTKIIQKLKAEATFEIDEQVPPSNDELPFCEICNEDAVLRCLGCKYLYCKQCYLEHRDDDDGCNRYESYRPKPH